jgi:hypothetical protein
MCNVQCVMCNVQCAMCNVQCITSLLKTYYEIVVSNTKSNNSRIFQKNVC